MSGSLALTRQLYERRFSREDVINLFQFIDWVMSLPEETVSTVDELRQIYQHSTPD